MKILIENLTFETIIGILEHERLTPQRVLIDCIIDYSYQTDQFINYADVASLIEKTMQIEQFQLIETALQTLSSVLKAHFTSIQNLVITIKKPDIMENCTVGVQNHFIF